MTTIAGPRGSGKTTELIRLCAEENARGVRTSILVVNIDRASQVAIQAENMGIDIPFPLILSELRGKLSGSPIRQILVDDADDLVRYFVRDATGRHVGAMTFTVDADQGDVTLLRYGLESIPGVTEMRPDDSEPSEAVVDSLRRENTVAFINDRMVAGTLSWGVKPTE